jgi:hypothetical protein
MKKERYIGALRKRVYALVEQGVITAEAGSVIMTCWEKRFDRIVHGFSVEKLPRLKSNKAHAFPAMTEYETLVFRRFARAHRPGVFTGPIQLEGGRQLAKVAAGHRLIAKGILYKPCSCHWYLTDFGKKMAEEWQRQNR